MNNTVSDEFFLRLEVVAQTDTEANHGGLTIVNGSAGSSHILITLSVRQNTVHIGALAQVILVTNRGHIVQYLISNASLAATLSASEAST